MRIIEVIIEAADPIGVNTVVGNHIEDANIGEGDNKTITGANSKATMDNSTPPMEAIIIITMAIIKAEVAWWNPFQTPWSWQSQLLRP